MVSIIYVSYCRIPQEISIRCCALHNCCWTIFLYLNIWDGVVTCKTSGTFRACPWGKEQMVQICRPILRCSISDIKDSRELSWMSHGVMRFWLLLNFLFILAFFDILASFSIFCVFISRWKSSCSDIPRTIIKFDYIN